MRLTTADFLAYDSDNPRVWELFKRFALEVVGAGRRSFGAKAIMERIRWYVEVETRGDPWKVNNDYAAFYARKFMGCYPEYLGFFRRRASVADALFPPEALSAAAGVQGRLWSNRPAIHNSTNAHLTPTGRRRNIRPRTGGV